MSAVPHTNQVEGTREHACLEHTKEESSRKQTSVVLHKALQHSNESETKHADTEPDAGFHLFEEDVGRDLEEDVGDEKDDQSSVVAIVPYQIKFRAEAKDVCVCNVDTIQESQEIHDAEEGNDMEVNLGHKFGFRGVGRTWNERRVVVVGIVIVRDWISLVHVRRRHIFCG